MEAETNQTFIMLKIYVKKKLKTIIVNDPINTIKFPTECVPIKIIKCSIGKSISDQSNNLPMKIVIFLPK